MGTPHEYTRVHSSHRPRHIHNLNTDHTCTQSRICICTCAHRYTHIHTGTYHRSSVQDTHTHNIVDTLATHILHKYTTHKCTQMCITDLHTYNRGPVFCLKTSSEKVYFACMNHGCPHGPSWTAWNPRMLPTTCRVTCSSRLGHRGCCFCHLTFS